MTMLMLGIRMKLSLMVRRIKMFMKLMEIMMKAVHERMEWVRIGREMKTMMIISRTT